MGVSFMFFAYFDDNFVAKMSSIRKATRIYVNVHSQWKGLMQGVCGNFDADSTNDLQ